MFVPAKDKKLSTQHQLLVVFVANSTYMGDVTVQSSWLRCRSVSPGMLPGEYTVVTSTSDGSVISLFAPAQYVLPKERLVQVTIVDRGDGAVLVYLPSHPLEGSSRTVKVPEKELIPI